MKAIPMKGRLTGKRVSGYLWAGPGKAWRKKENYFQVEDNRIVSGCLLSDSGSFWLRFYGETCEIKLYGPKGRILGSTVLSLPRRKTTVNTSERKGLELS